MSIKFKVIYLKENGGLGNALRIALENCSNEIVARMDSDDISHPCRFELQMKKMMENQEIDIVGGNITEFVGSDDNIIWQRRVPEEDWEIKKEMKNRCAMNHMSVMYKKRAVQGAGGYLDWAWNEDYYLWIRMILKGCVFANIPQNVVNVRTGSDMYSRRGGMAYFKSEKNIQRYMYVHKMINIYQYIYNVVIRFFGEVITPTRLRSKLFYFMRKKYVEENVTPDHELCDEYIPFSVAMSVYKKDNPDWFKKAIDSVIKQTYAPDEIVLVVDGNIPSTLNEVIKQYMTEEILMEE